MEMAVMFKPFCWQCSTWHRLDEPHADEDNIASLTRQLAEARAEVERLREALAHTAAMGTRDEREYDPGVAPCDDAEFGMKP